MTISEFLQREQRASDLLDIVGLSYRGNEHKTLIELCTAQQKNEEDLFREIKKFRKGAKFQYPSGIFRWSPELVVSYLEEEHHSYTRRLIRDAEYFGKRACDVHGSQYPELSQVKWYVNQLTEKVKFHLKFEEQKFFPLALSFLKQTKIPGYGATESLKKQISVVQKHQQEIEYFFKRIREVTKNFTPPQKACTTFRLFYSTLRKLDTDLAKHHFLEEQYIITKLQIKMEEN